MLLVILSFILVVLIALRHVAIHEAARLHSLEQAHNSNWVIQDKYTQGYGDHLYCYGLYIQYRQELVGNGEPYGYCIDEAYTKMITTLEYNKMKKGELFHPFHGHLTLVSEILLKRVSFVA